MDGNLVPRVFLLHALSRLKSDKEREREREREREPRGEFGPLGLRDINIFLLMFLTELLGVEGQSIFESPACSGIAVGTEHSPT